ncbi:unnamed protein product [Cuscuta campestris]|uniref:Uncharacterized protein n=1 Tax=Cuscuta campestris TaxID=132261 RepID=A0A484LV99_9ASTE|nr:unnamed protein product [Cuscuta campestris]
MKTSQIPLRNTTDLRNFLVTNILQPWDITWYSDGIQYLVELVPERYVADFGSVVRRRRALRGVDAEESPLHSGISVPDRLQFVLRVLVPLRRRHCPLPRHRDVPPPNPPRLLVVAHGHESDPIRVLAPSVDPSLGISLGLLV